MKEETSYLLASASSVADGVVPVFLLLVCLVVDEP